MSLIIAIDGPAGAGKSTVAGAVAEKLTYRKIDTGALYRAVALSSQNAGIDWHDGDAIVAHAKSLKLSLDPEASCFQLMVNGNVVDKELRTEMISMGASVVSAYPGVRDALLQAQRDMGAGGGVVLEGRDIGTVVFPNAELKIFLTASAEERARRRAEELRARGDERTTEAILSAMKERDRRDSGRPVAPLKAAEDAVNVDTSSMSFDEVVAHIVELAKSRGA